MFNSVYAAGEHAAAQQGDSLSMFIMMGIFFCVFYFMLIRPKQKKEQQQRSLVSNLSRGDEVMTYSGLMGKIARIKDNYVVVAITDNVEIKLQKNYISNVLPKGTLKSI